MPSRLLVSRLPYWADLRLVAVAFGGAAALVTLPALLATLPRAQNDASAQLAHARDVLGAAATLHRDFDGLISVPAAGAAPESDAAYGQAIAGRVAADIVALRAATAEDATEREALTHLSPPLAGTRPTTDVVEAIAIIRNAEWQSLDRVQHAVIRAIWRTVAGVVLAGAIAAGCALWIVATVLRRRAERRRLAGMLAMTVGLEQLVAARTGELAASEARQRSYFRKVPIGLTLLRCRDDGDFVIEDLNPASEAMYRFDREAVVDHALSDVWPELDARDMNARMRSCADSRQRLQYVVQRRVQGVARHVEVLLIPFLDAAGDAERLLACSRDVTEERGLGLRVAELTRQQIEIADRERALFQNSPDAMTILRVIDTAGERSFVYESCSPAVERLTGIRAVDLIGHQPQQCLPADVAATTLQHLYRCVAARTTVAYTITANLPLGTRTFDVTLTPISHPVTGLSYRVATCGRDVSDRRAMEAALRHGQKMEAVGRLAAGVAHDFNNTLQGIIGSLELGLDDAVAGSAAQELMAMALSAARRGAFLTHHLLSYARKQAPRPQPVDLAGALAEMRKLLARTIGPHIALDVRVAPGTPPVLADPGQLDTVVLNLAINAAAAMPHGGALLLQARAEIVAGAAFVAMTVTDTGIGMDEATLEQAAEPFFTTKGAEGTGLGLAMVQEFAAQAGGRCEIASVAGEGTTVTLRLPASAAVPAPQTVEIPVAAGVPGSVLLVDDSADVLITTAAFLANAGFRVVQTDSGVKALALLAGAECFDALVCDYAMPSMNGFDLIAEGRILVPNLAALIITGYGGVEGARALPADVPVLHKPFMRAELLDALFAVLKRSRGDSHPSQGQRRGLLA